VSPSRLLPCGLVLLLLVGSTGCGGGDSNERPSPPKGVTKSQLDALKLDSPRGQVFAQLGAKPVSTRTLLAPANPKRPKGRKVPFSCYRFRMRGGKPRDRAELCFKRGTLQSVFSSVSLSSQQAKQEAEGLQAPRKAPPAPKKKKQQQR
jgi:hypothetical protein